MAEWIETYRGVVNAWECDIVEHFTIAYYFERFADATRNFLELIGDSETLGPAVGTGGSRLYTTFTQELRAGAGFHMLSAVVAIDENSLQIGHQVVASGSEQTVSWVMETLPLPVSATPQLRRRLEAQASAWPGPEVASADSSQDDAGGTHRPRPREAVGARRRRDDVARRPGPSVLSSRHAIPLLDRHDCRVYESAPPRLLDLGAGPEACCGRESGRPDRRTDINRASRQYLPELSSSHEPWRRSRDRVSRAGRCASRPRCPAPDSDAVGNKGIDLQAVAENVDVFRTGEKTWPIPMAR